MSQGIEPIPRDWVGRSVLLVGSGPSLEFDDVELFRRHGFLVLACNDNYMADPDVLYVPDYPWAEANPDCLRIAERWTPESKIAQNQPGWRLCGIGGGKPSPLSTNPMVLGHGGHAGFQMLNMAFLRGASAIVMTGYDMQSTNGKPRWRGRHPDGVEKGGADKFEAWRRSFTGTYDQLEADGVQVFNCSRQTALTEFPLKTPEEVLCLLSKRSIPAATQTQSTSVVRPV